MGILISLAAAAAVSFCPIAVSKPWNVIESLLGAEFEGSGGWVGGVTLSKKLSQIPKNPKTQLPTPLVPNLPVGIQ